MADLTIPMEFAVIREVKLEEHNKNEIRVYKSSSDGFTFQIRTFKPITAMGTRTPRDMYASVTIDIVTMKKILSYMKKESGERW